MRPRARKCLDDRLGVAEARSERQMRLSSPAKAGDPVTGSVRFNARSRSTGYPAFAGYDKRERRRRTTDVFDNLSEKLGGICDGASRRGERAGAGCRWLTRRS